MRVLFKFIPFVLDAFLLLQSPNFLTDFIRLYIVKPRLIFTTLMSNNSIFHICLILLSLRVIPWRSPWPKASCFWIVCPILISSLSQKCLRGEFLQMFTLIWTQEWTSLEFVGKISTVRIIVTFCKIETNPVADIELQVIGASPCGKALLY